MELKDNSKVIMTKKKKKLLSSSLTTEKTKEEGEYIRKEYAYMDNLPLEGWIWEFIRRSEKYKSLLDECMQNYQIISDESHKKYFFEWIEKFSEICLDVYFEFGKPKERCYHVLRFNDPIKHTSIGFLALPKIDLKFNEFHTNPPSIIGNTMVKTISYEKVQQWLSFCENESGRFDADDVKTLLNWIAPSKSKNTLFLGISTVCKIDDLRAEIELLIRKHVKTRKTKEMSPKWKYYLIAYDLKGKYTNENITTILQEAYPELVKAVKNTETKPQTANSQIDEEKKETIFNDRNITNYREGAISLIDRSTYKKYLYI